MLKSNPLSGSNTTKATRPARRNRLVVRLTIFILLFTVLLIGVDVFIATQAGSLIESQANTGLRDAAERTEDSLRTWLRMNGQAIQTLASTPGMSGMNADQQLPILLSVGGAYSDMFLVHTLDLNGRNVARSDGGGTLDYHDRQWFIQAKGGAPLSYQVVISKTINKPVLAIAAPIKDFGGNLVGVASGVTMLTQVNAAVGETIVGQTGFVFVVDDQNKLIMHPQVDLTSGGELMDYSTYPPIAAARKGSMGIVTFSDDKGKTWRSYVAVMDNQWVVISQEPLDELLAPLHRFQAIAIIVTGVIVIFLLVLIGWGAQQLLIKPISELGEAAEAIAAGDLTRSVEISGEDEIAMLGTAFNNMTDQLRDLVGTLEHRVAERTAQLEEANEHNVTQSNLLRSIAEITRQVSRIQNLDVLLPEITRQISSALGLYHVAIYLNDQNRQFAVLRDASSEAGKKMLERNYRVKIDQSSLIGFVASTGQSRLASEASDELHFSNDNPDLADTQSEMALPMRVGDTIIGVLDLQSSDSSALTGKEIETMTLLADQISIAIQNNLSFEETRNALERSEAAYQQSATKGWNEFLSQGKTGYRYVNGNIEVLGKSSPGTMDEVQSSDEDVKTINIPIVIRGQKLGAIRIRQQGRDHAWDENETRTLQSIVERLSFALENARLYSDAQQRATRERVIGEITTKIRSVNDPNEMIRVAVDELKQALKINDVRIVPYNPPQNGNGHKEG